MTLRYSIDDGARPRLPSKRTLYVDGGAPTRSGRGGDNGQGQVFNTHCMYELGVEKQQGRWVICYLRQRVLWSEGNPAVHPGARDREKH